MEALQVCLKLSKFSNCVRNLIDQLLKESWVPAPNIREYFPFTSICAATQQERPTWWQPGVHNLKKL